MKARLRALLQRARSYDPVRYWEGRAEDLIQTYDDPEAWEARGWLRYDEEQSTLPALFAQHAVSSILVVGAGSGRQYVVLQGRGLALRGIDISPRLVAECRERYPDIPTEVCDVIGAEASQPPVDAVLSTAVLQHVRPADVRRAVDSCKALARSLVVLREQTRRTTGSGYQWAHDFHAAFLPWVCVHAEVTDRLSDGTEVSLLAFAPPDSGA